MPNIENDAIDNDEVEIEQPAVSETEAVEAEPVESEAPKSISLDDAIAEAYKKHADATKDAPAKKKGALPGTPAVEGEPTKLVDPLTGRESEPIKAPAGWTPTLQEKWKGMDPVVQKFITDREAEMARNFTKTADDRKLATEFRDIAAPYEAMLRGFNTTASAHAKDLFNLSHTLNTGSPQTRAQVIYNLINHFQPDPDTLKGLFAGQPAPRQVQPQVDIQAEIDKAIKLRDEEQTKSTIQRDIEAFSSDPKNEFYPHVEVMMGKILSAELVDAPTMPELLKKAYDMACSQHPEVAQVLKTRVPAAPVVKAGQPTAKAVGSVKPSLSAGQRSKPATPKSVSLDDAVTKAFAMHAG